MLMLLAGATVGAVPDRKTRKLAPPAAIATAMTTQR
jgi:hypothetical protein